MMAFFSYLSELEDRVQDTSSNHYFLGNQLLFQFGIFIQTELWKLLMILSSIMVLSYWLLIFLILKPLNTSRTSLHPIFPTSFLVFSQTHLLLLKRLESVHSLGFPGVFSWRCFTNSFLEPKLTSFSRYWLNSIRASKPSPRVLLLFSHVDLYQKKNTKDSYESYIHSTVKLCSSITAKFESFEVLWYNMEADELFYPIIGSIQNFLTNDSSVKKRIPLSYLQLLVWTLPPSIHFPLPRSNEPSNLELLSVAQPAAYCSPHRSSFCSRVKWSDLLNNRSSLNQHFQYWSRSCFFFLWQ